MDKFEEFEEEIKKLEETFPMEEDVLKYLVEPTAVDYWRKKLSEEKSLFEKILETKEQEKKTLEEKIKQLQQQLKFMEKQMESSKEYYETQIEEITKELARKEAEKVKEREKVLLEEKIRELTRKNELLEQEINSMRETYKNEKDAMLMAHKMELESLSKNCEEILSAVDKIEQEMDSIRSQSSEKVKILDERVKEISYQLKNLEDENKQLKKIINEMETKYKVLMEQRYQNHEKIKNYISSVSEYQRNELTKIFSLIMTIISTVKSKPNYRKALIGQVEIIAKLVSKLNEGISQYIQLLNMADLELVELDISYFLPFARSDKERELLSQKIKVKIDVEKINELFESLKNLDLNFSLEKDKLYASFLSDREIPYIHYLQCKKVAILNGGDFIFKKTDGLYSYLLTLPVIEGF